MVATHCQTPEIRSWLEFLSLSQPVMVMTRGKNSWVYHINHHFPYYSMATRFSDAAKNIDLGLGVWYEHQCSSCLEIHKWVPDFFTHAKTQKRWDKKPSATEGCTGVFFSWDDRVIEREVDEKSTFSNTCCKAAANKTLRFWGVMGLQIHAKAESSVSTSEIGGNQFGGNQYR